MLSTSGIGSPMIHATSGRGFTTDELTARCVDKIVSIADTADPMVQAQARAFKSQLHAVILKFMNQAVASYNTTLANRFVAAGHPELVAFLREQ